MIPDFKTYLNESVWGDLRKKSLGQEVRTEEDVNLMDMEGFKNYLYDRYTYPEPDYEYVKISDLEPEELFVVFTGPIFKFGSRWALYIDYKRNIVTFNDIKSIKDTHKELPQLFEKLNSRYKLERKKNDRFTTYIVEPDKKATNSFFLEVIDFIVDMNDENIILKRK